MLLQTATDLVAPELEAVDRIIRARLDSDIKLIREVGAHIIQSGGKRLRPVILLLSAKAGNYRGGDHILLAAVVEFIHTATLLHDDVVDASHMRRGRATANQLWGNQASVLVGDFLYSRSFEMMLEARNMEVMRILAATTNSIAEGEVMQLLNARSAKTSEADYLETIRRKTATLFESAAQLGMLIGECAEWAPALGAYGAALGCAFQLIDDMLDYNAGSGALGKNAGDDLAEGKPTLPLIHALRHGTARQRATVRRALENGERERLGEILAIIESTGALAYTAQLARRQAAAAVEALAGIGESPFKQALIALADFAVRRGR
ncbi:MAG: polyprenyl synthetase family protein [Gammaproteobacteria bacterium]